MHIAQALGIEQMHIYMKTSLFIRFIFLSTIACYICSVHTLKTVYICTYIIFMLNISALFSPFVTGVSLSGVAEKTDSSFSSSSCLSQTVIRMRLLPARVVHLRTKSSKWWSGEKKKREMKTKKTKINLLDALR